MAYNERMNTQANETRQEDNINSKDFLIGALVGGMVGAAAALFLAPKTGKELRTDLNEQAAVLKEKTGHLKDTAMTKGSELASAAKEKTSTLTQSVSKQSSGLVEKVKGMSGKSGSQSDDSSAEEEAFTETVPSGSAAMLSEEDGESIQQKLEETKNAFDETEMKYR
ncbi:YtxH domain-containing protein [Bacillus infantis]|jgi:gas vesicle protein|uniref:YtxH domain-containing protein n=1 Tax=Bacillus infantis TaxID=324767 RepID=UPI002155BC28|nr:YtxH domain-containing protein [Bacillus infantis]MCR6612333.1 YtxH domain-containing protein [Bacillus infantis]